MTKLSEKINNILEAKKPSKLEKEAEDFYNDLIKRKSKDELKDTLAAWKSMPKKSAIEKNLIKLLSGYLKENK